MTLEKLSENYICERHPKQEIMQWADRLQYFQFKRAYGGFASDGDQFELWIKFDNEPDMLRKLNQLGIALTRIPDDHPKAEIGKAYSSEEREIFKSEITAFPHWEQPMHRTVFGESIFVWVHNGNEIEISVAGTNGDAYEVSNADFEKCLRLEKHFEALDWTRYFDRKSGICVISKEKYPEFYAKPKRWWLF